MIDLIALGLTFVGFWDRCFFSNQAANSGITVKDQTGAEHSYTYAELYNMMKKLKEQNNEALKAEL